ncbi:MAG TPA: NifB/NifX family molybdenum-iron cluster-binding protein [Bacteroidales bacterium]|nr:NifB/NifX family molybdenum-iron cluster-binding protein [Bacteroidales bacterium]
MKIAITSQGSQLDSIIDQRFGRCSYFVIYDTEKQTSEFLQNPNKLIEEGAGPASVQFLANQDVEKVVSGEFGVKIKPLMDQLKMGMIIIKEPNSIEKIIRVLNTKEY